MSSHIEKIESLETNLNKSLKKAKRNLVTVTVVFIIIIVFVISYTSYIYTSVKSLATPENIAAYVAGKVQDKIPEITANINENSKEYANLMAIETIKHARSLLPLGEAFTKEQLSLATDSINAELNSKYLPALNEYFALNKQEILSTFDSLTDQEIAQQLTSMMLSQLDTNMALLQEPFNDSVNKLQEHVDMLASTPDSELTKQEVTEKKAIAYWIYLLDHQSEMTPAWQW